MRGIEAQREADVRHVDDLEQQLQHPVIVNPFAEHGFQNIVLDTVKEVADVHFQNILHVPWVGVDPLLHDFLGLMGAASWDARIAVTIQSAPEHLTQSHDNAVLNDQFFKRRDDDDPLLVPDTVLNDDWRVLRVLIVDNPVIGQCQHCLIGQMAFSYHLPDPLCAFGLLNGPAAVFFRYADVKQVFVGFHYSLILSPAFASFRY